MSNDIINRIILDNCVLVSCFDCSCLVYQMAGFSVALCPACEYQKTEYPLFVKNIQAHIDAKRIMPMNLYRTELPEKRKVINFLNGIETEETEILLAIQKITKFLTK